MLWCLNAGESKSIKRCGAFLNGAKIKQVYYLLRLRAIVPHA